MEYVWHETWYIYGICLEYIWNVYEIHMDIYEIYMKYNIHRIYMEYVWHYMNIFHEISC